MEEWSIVDRRHPSRLGNTVCPLRCPVQTPEINSALATNSMHGLLQSKRTPVVSDMRANKSCGCGKHSVNRRQPLFFLFLCRERRNSIDICSYF